MSGQRGAHRLSLWHNRDYTLLWGGQAVSALGGEVANVSLPLLVLALTGSAVDAGGVATVRAAALYLGGLLGGLWVDRASRRAVVVVCEVVRGAAMGTLVVLVLMRNASLTAILVLGAVGALFSAPVSPALDAALLRVVPPEDVDQAIAQDQARMQGASLVGPGLGGLLFGLARFVPFLFNGLSYLCSIAGVLGIRASLAVERPPARTDSLLMELTAGFRWLWRHSSLAQLCAVLGLVNFASGGLDILIIVLAHRSGASSAEVGVALAIGALGGITGSLVAARLVNWVGRLGSVLLALWGMATCILLMAIVPGFAGLGSIYALMNVLMPAANVVLSGKLLRMVPDDLRGRVMSALYMFTSGLGAFGPFATGLLILDVGKLAALALATPVLVGAALLTAIPTLRSVVASDASAG